MDRLKRYLFVITLLASCAALSACGDDGDKNNNSNNSSPANNMSMSNNASTSNNASSNNMSSPNNMSTSNNASTSNNTSTPEGCQPLEPALGVCDPVCQTGCDDGQTCALGMTGLGAPLMSTCVAAGAGAAGATCMDPSDCEAGMLCITPAQGQPGTCRPACDAQGGEPMCADGSCVRASMEIERLGACAPTCTAFPNDMCDSGQCYPNDQMGGTACFGPGAVEIGASCTNLNDCVEGAICANGTCAALCATPGTQDTCDENALCRTLTGSFHACVASCTPFPEDNCGADQQCYPAQDGGTFCGPYDATAQVGDACQFLNDCNQGQFCSNSICAKRCNSAGDNSDCEGGDTCANIPNTSVNICVSM